MAVTKIRPIEFYGYVPLSWRFQQRPCEVLSILLYVCVMCLRMCATGDSPQIPESVLYLYFFVLHSLTSHTWSEGVYRKMNNGATSIIMNFSSNFLVKCGIQIHAVYLMNIWKTLVDSFLYDVNINISCKKWYFKLVKNVKRYKCFTKCFFNVY